MFIGTGAHQEQVEITSILMASGVFCPHLTLPLLSGDKEDWRTMFITKKKEPLPTDQDSGRDRSILRPKLVTLFTLCSLL